MLKYLARYTHRMAISNSRLTAFDGQRVSFQWKDYADDNRQKSMTLAADEFVRRFLLHVLPRDLPASATMDSWPTAIGRRRSPLRGD